MPVSRTPTTTAMRTEPTSSIQRVTSDDQPTLELAVPATPWHRYTYPDGTSAWSVERIDPVLEVD